MRRALAAAAVALAVLATVRYEGDRTARRPANQFLTDFDVPFRHPDAAATLPLVPVADLGADIVGDITLSDAFGSVHLADATPEQRVHAPRATERVGDELVGARDIPLDALATRPGWAEHWTVLGQLVYA